MVQALGLRVETSVDTYIYIYIYIGTMRRLKDYLENTHIRVALKVLLKGYPSRTNWD